MTVPSDDELADVASAHPAVTRRETSGQVTYDARGTEFAAVRGATTEFRLRPDMVRAALRTPGTRASERGPDWVAFDVPDEPERHDVDRLRAWFEMAARLAGG